MRWRVYVAGPISKPTTVDGLYHNIKQADDATAELMQVGIAVFNPMLSVYLGGCYVESNDLTGQREVLAEANRKANDQFRAFQHHQWLAMDFAWIDASHGLLRLPGESVGADAEVKHAHRRNLPVFYSVADCIEFFRESTELRIVLGANDTKRIAECVGETLEATSRRLAALNEYVERHARHFEMRASEAEQDAAGEQAERVEMQADAATERATEPAELQQQ